MARLIGAVFVDRPHVAFLAQTAIAVGAVTFVAEILTVGRAEALGRLSSVAPGPLQSRSSDSSVAAGSVWPPNSHSVNCDFDDDNGAVGGGGGGGALCSAAEVLSCEVQAVASVALITASSAVLRSDAARAALERAAAAGIIERIAELACRDAEEEEASLKLQARAPRVIVTD